MNSREEDHPLTAGGGSGFQQAPSQRKATARPPPITTLQPPAAASQTFFQEMRCTTREYLQAHFKRFRTKPLVVRKQEGGNTSSSETGSGGSQHHLQGDPPAPLLGETPLLPATRTSGSNGYGGTGDNTTDLTYDWDAQAGDLDVGSGDDSRWAFVPDFDQLSEAEKQRFRVKHLEPDSRIQNQRSKLTELVKRQHQRSQSEQSATTTTSGAPSCSQVNLNLSIISRSSVLSFPKGEGLDTIPFFKEAPQHFGSVSELVQLIGGYLNEKPDVMSASSVNRKWRAALLWSSYQEDVAKLPRQRYVPNIDRAFHMLPRWYRIIPAITYALWFLYFIAMAALLLFWVGDAKDFSHNEHTVRSDLMITAIVFTVLLIVIFAGPGMMFITIFTWALRRKGYNTLRLCTVQISSMFTGLLLFACWLICTVSLDVVAIMQDPSALAPSDPSSAPLPRGTTPATTGSTLGFTTLFQVLGLEDQSIWATKAVQAQSRTLLKVYHSEGWKQLPTVASWVYLSSNSKCSKDQGAFGTQSHCTTFKVLRPLSFKLWKYSGPFPNTDSLLPGSPQDQGDPSTNNSRTSPLPRCSEPRDDQFPTRLFYLPLQAAASWGWSATLNFNDLLLYPPAFGVEEVHIVIVNPSAVTEWIPKGAGTYAYDDFELNFYDLPSSGSSATAAAGQQFREFTKWASLTLYNVKFCVKCSSLTRTGATSAADQERQRMALSDRLGGIPVNVITPAELNATLLAEPYNMSLSEAKYVVKSDPSKTRQYVGEVALALAASRKAGTNQSSSPPAGIPPSQVDLFTQPAAASVTKVTLENQIGLEDQVQTSILEQKEIGLWAYSTTSNKFTRSTYNNIMTLNWNAISARPKTPNCSFPTLAQNPFGFDIFPNDRGGGGGSSFIYTGKRSYWFKGQSGFEEFETEYWANYVGTPMMGGYPIPFWCRDETAALLFRAVSFLCFFLVTPIIQCGIGIEFYHRLWTLSRLKRKSAHFGLHHKLWWQGRQEQHSGGEAKVEAQ